MEKIEIYWGADKDFEEATKKFEKHILLIRCYGSY